MICATTPQQVRPEFVGSRRVVEDAIDQSKLNPTSTWGELIPQCKTSVEYPLPASFGGSSKKTEDDE